MVIAFAVFPYLIGGIAMWFVAHLVAPIGYTVSISRCAFALVLMSCGEAVAGHFLRPVIGQWYYLTDFAVSAALGTLVLQMTFWRSLLAVFVYEVICLAVAVVILLVFKPGEATNHPAAANSAIVLAVQIGGHWRGVTGR